MLRWGSSIRKYFCNAYPTILKKFCGKSLHAFCAECGTPEKRTFDGAKEQTKSGTYFMKTVREYGMLPYVIEPDRHNQNRVEGVIRKIRKKLYRVMLKKKAPRRICDYGLWPVREIMQRNTSWSEPLEGRTPLEMLTGETPDISEYLDFRF